jgi:hypothetical protein
MISEMQALSSFWRPIFHIIFYTALFRTQCWLEDSSDAVLATFPLMETEVLPELIQQAQELLRQMRPETVNCDTDRRYSAVVNKLSTYPDEKVSGPEEISRSLRNREQSLEDDAKD